MFTPLRLLLATALARQHPAAALRLASSPRAAQEAEEPLSILIYAHAVGASADGAVRRGLCDADWRDETYGQEEAVRRELREFTTLRWSEDAGSVRDAELARAFRAIIRKMELGDVVGERARQLHAALARVSTEGGSPWEADWTKGPPSTRRGCATTRSSGSGSRSTPRCERRSGRSSRASTGLSAACAWKPRRGTGVLMEGTGSGWGVTLRLVSVYILRGNLERHGC